MLKTQVRKTIIVHKKQQMALARKIFYNILKIYYTNIITTTWQLPIQYKNYTQSSHNLLVYSLSSLIK